MPNVGLDRLHIRTDDAATEMQEVNKFVIFVQRCDDHPAFAIFGLSDDVELASVAAGSHAPAHHLTKEAIVVLPVIGPRIGPALTGVTGPDDAFAQPVCPTSEERVVDLTILYAGIFWFIGEECNSTSGLFLTVVRT